ncbi:MAG TPA: hypothetical protein ACFE0H_08115 [Elainellaceae cyanobacterium]|jgi:uncharacterized membrane protein YdbT with pleckstrin-like domain
MNSRNDREDGLRRRELDLQRREREIRLRELEAELSQKEIPIYPTVKHGKPKPKRWLKKLSNVGKFMLMVIVAAVILRVSAFIAIWLIWAIIVGAIAWVGYKLLLEDGDRD